MEKLKVYTYCGRCNGTGIAHTVSGSAGNEVVEDPCTACLGVGFFATGTIDGAEQLATISDKLDEILERLKKK